MKTLKSVPFDALEVLPPGSMMRSPLPGFQVGGERVYRGKSSGATSESMRKVIYSVPAREAVKEFSRERMHQIAGEPGITNDYPDFNINELHKFRLKPFIGSRPSLRMKPTRAKVKFNPHAPAHIGWKERGLLFERSSGKVAKTLEAHTPYPGGEVPRWLRPKVKRAKKVRAGSKPTLYRDTFQPPATISKRGWTVALYVNKLTKHFVVVREPICDCVDTSIECPHNMPAFIETFTLELEALNKYGEHIRWLNKQPVDKVKAPAMKQIA